MRAHLDPNRRASTKLEPSLPKDQTTNSENELSGAAAVHKMAQLESNFLTQSLSGGMQNLFGAKAAAAAAAFAGLAAQPSLADRPNLKFEDTKSKQFKNFPSNSQKHILKRPSGAFKHREKNFVLFSQFFSLST